MGKLTMKDDQGNWCLRGLSWKQLHIGQLISHEVSDKLYGALWKLMQYEDTELTPEQIIELINFEKTQSAELLKKLGSFTLCEECKYCKTEEIDLVRWCRLSNGLDGDLEDGAGCSRGKKKGCIVK